MGIDGFNCVYGSVLRPRPEVDVFISAVKNVTSLASIGPLHVTTTCKGRVVELDAMRVDSALQLVRDRYALGSIEVSQYSAMFHPAAGWMTDGDDEPVRVHWTLFSSVVPALCAAIRAEFADDLEIELGEEDRYCWFTLTQRWSPLPVDAIAGLEEVLDKLMGRPLVQRMLVT